MLNATIDFLQFFGIAFGGFLLETFLIEIFFALMKERKKANHYSFWKYAFALVSPTIATFLAFLSIGIEVFIVFSIFSVVGTLGEWITGYGLHKILGQRIWTHHLFILGCYTSLLSVPLWGFLGIFFWLLARVFL